MASSPGALQISENTTEVTQAKVEAYLNSQASNNPNENPKNNTSSISPGGSAFTSGVSSLKHNWYPEKLHQLLEFFSRDSYLEPKWNFSTTESGLHVNLFWQDKSFQGNPQLQFNCLSQVANSKQALVEIPKKKQVDKSHAMKSILSNYPPKDDKQQDLAKLFSSFQESPDVAEQPPPAKRPRPGDEFVSDDRSTTPIIEEPNKALLSQLMKRDLITMEDHSEKSSEKEGTKTPKTGQNNIKDALEQLLAQNRGSKNNLEATDTKFNLLNSLHAAVPSTQPLVINNLSQSSALPTTQSTPNSMPSVDSMLTQNNLLNSLKTSTASNLNLNSLLQSTANPNLNILSQINPASGNTNFLTNLNGMLAAAQMNSNNTATNSFSNIDLQNSTPENLNNSSQQRRVPVRFTAEQKKLLYQIFEVNRYPKKPEREEIAAKINVPEYAIHNFFSNTRKAIYRAAAVAPGSSAIHDPENSKDA